VAAQRGEFVGRVESRECVEVVERCRHRGLHPHESAVRVAEHAVREIFYHDCSDADVAFARARLSEQSTASFASTLTGAAWREIPSTYVLCTDDRTVPVPVQHANAARTTTILELATSHSPFFSAPDDLVALLVGVARDA